VTLKDGQAGKDYIVEQILTNDEEMDSFLFSLGCYSGETVSLIKFIKGGCVISVKNGRYHIDDQLAGAIRVRE